MKQLLFSLLAITILFSSCASDDVLTEPADTNSKMLESFTVMRNANGSYALSHDVAEGTGTVYFDDKINNEVHLIFDENNTKSTSSRNYNVNDNELNIVFVSENDSSQPRIRIIDDNTELSTKRDNLGLLNTYSITTNEDGTIQMNFKVENGVDVAFGYNDSDSINDIYLSEDENATQLYYSKNYEKGSDGSLRIDFVQANATKDDESDTKKPRIIFDDAVDDFY